MNKQFKSGWKLLKQTIRAYRDSDTSTLGAATSYYTIFSLAPILIIIIAIAGLAFGPEAVRGEISEQIAGTVGTSAAEQIETMIVAAYEPRTGVVATVLAIAFLILGTSGLFSQLKRSLNMLWEVKPKPSKGYIKFIRSRVLSFAMVVCIGFLLLISLTAHALLAAFTGHLSRTLPELSVVLIRVMDVLLAFGLTFLLLALTYKFLSDAKLRWRNAWTGALFTAVLFTIGKYLLGIYLGRSDYLSTYGAAGSIVLVLVWVYYSAQIFFLGAQFTRVVAQRRGDQMIPQEYAIKQVKVEVEQGAHESAKHFKQKVAAVKEEAKQETDSK